MSPPNESVQPPRRGALRRGNIIEAPESGLRFKIPESWVRWHQANPSYPNLHLAPEELDMVEDATGEWDREFALVVNAMLPFDRCVAHVGAEGWGHLGQSYADLQVRAYVLLTSIEEIKDRARTQGIRAVVSLTEAPVSTNWEVAGKWQRMVLTYPRSYIDYSARAVIELWLTQWANRTFAFAFMGTDHVDHSRELEQLLKSVEFGP